MIGRAAAEWNSLCGVPVSTWFLFSTAISHCHGCDRIRSFDGDLAHRDSTGTPVCLRDGIEGKGALVLYNGKGKGRAFS